MKHIPLLTTISLTILLSACSSNPVTVSMSTTRFDNPEVSSEPLQVNMALLSGNRTTLAIEGEPDKIDSFEDIDGTDLHGLIRGNITAAKGLEISIRKDDDSAAHIGIKYQFYGAHTEQSSKGNISQAFTVGYERNTTSAKYTPKKDSVNCNMFSCDQMNTNGTWEHDTNIYDIAWVAGYKFTERAIIYGGPFYQWGQLDGYKTPYNEANGSNEKLKSNGYMVGANIAIEHRFSFGMGLAGEVVYSNIDWDKYSQSDTSFNVKIDYQF